MVDSTLTQINTIRSQALAMIEELTLHPKPTYRIEGQEVDWGKYLQQLQDTVKWCDAQIAYAEPYEIQTKATS